MVGFFWEHIYGLLFACAALSAYGVTWFLLHRRGERVLLGHLDSLTIIAVIFGIIGARSLFVLYHLDYFSLHLVEIPAFWQGGWVWQGGFLGGTFGVWLYVRVFRLPFVVLADCIVPGLALGQAIGRWGNFFNQEAYGFPTTLPWGVFIDLARRLPGYEAFEYFHPTFFYESVGDLGLFLVLFYLVRSRYFGEGGVMLAYVLGYAFLRFFIEFLRIDLVPVWFGLRAPQWISLVFIIVSLALLPRLRARAKLST